MGRDRGGVSTDPRTGARPGRSRGRRSAPTLEPLESRELLSFYTGASANRPVLAAGGAYLIQVSGPGVVEVQHAPRGAIDVKAFGTTTSTTLTITLTKPRFHATGSLLAIRNLQIRSGQLGALSAMPVELEGRMTPLAGSIASMDLGMIGPKAQVAINGSVGEMTVSNIDLGPTGRVAIAGDINTFAQGSSLPQPIQPAGSTTTTGGSSSSGSGTSGSTTASTGAMTIGAITIDGGRFTIGRDSLASIAINGDVSISQDGRFSIGRDQNGSFTVNGSMLLSTGGQLIVGRNLASLAITGNLIVQPSGSGVAVDGALQQLSVGGYFQGQGGQGAPTSVDLGVGLNLSNLTILGGVSGQGGLINANVRAGGTVGGVNIAYGQSNSTIQSNATMPT